MCLGLYPVLVIGVPGLVEPEEDGEGEEEVEDGAAHRHGLVAEAPGALSDRAGVCEGLTLLNPGLLFLPAKIKTAGPTVHTETFKQS